MLRRETTPKYLKARGKNVSLTIEVGGTTKKKKKGTVQGKKNPSKTCPSLAFRPIPKTSFRGGGKQEEDTTVFNAFHREEERGGWYGREGAIPRGGGGGYKGRGTDLAQGKLSKPKGATRGG